MDKQEFEWKYQQLCDKAEDLFDDEDDACYILSTGFKCDDHRFAGYIKACGSDKNIMMSAARMICTVAQNSKDEDTTPRMALNALFMVALKMLMDDDEKCSG